jgi:hypothetical protein
MRSVITLAFLTGLLSASASALAQRPDPNAKIPLSPPTPNAAAPYGANYYPGIGFRYLYVLSPGPRVYGYYAAPGGYRRGCRSQDFWFWDRNCTVYSRARSRY